MKDTKDFNERFQRWKNGENYWQMRGVSLNTNSDRPATKEQVEQIKSRLVKFQDGKDDGKDVQYTRQNGNPVAFDEQGNLIDQVTGQTGVMQDEAFNRMTVTPQGVKFNFNGVIPNSSTEKPKEQIYLEPTDLLALANPVLNRLSPTQNVRAIYDTFDPSLTWQDKLNSWFIGNAGITSNEFQQEHPWLSTGINLVGDAGIVGGLYGINRLSAAQNAARLQDYNSQLEALNRFNVNRPVRISKPQPSYQIQRYPGWMLGSLMEGNPLEKQLSKTGTVSVNSIRAQAAKASKVDKSIIEDILSSEQFANQKSVDYNDFRKAIQGRLIDYYRTPSEHYAEYGANRIGLNIPNRRSFSDLERAILDTYPGQYRMSTYSNDLIDNITNRPIYNMSELENILYKGDVADFNTFTFRSPKVPFGNDTHYAETPVGHSRTYTLRNDPHTLYVMESQSDWGQHEIGTPKFRAEVNEDGVYNITRDSNGNYIYTEPNKGTVTKQQIVDSNYEILKQAKQNLMDDISTSSYDENIRHLHDDYQLRQIQENLRYAAENGQSKMRYPTPETAAKIEGYKKRDIFELEPDFEKTVRDIENRVYTEAGANPDDYEVPDPQEIAESLHNNSNEEFISRVRDMGVKNKSAERDIIELLEKARRLYRTKYDYRPEHQTILRKYSAFPKQFKKLWKNQDVRTVTDNKGNTWYEVDVPKNFLNREWMYGMLPFAIGGSALYGTAELGDNYTKGKDAYENIRIPKKKTAKRK